MVSVNENGKAKLDKEVEYDVINVNGKVKCDGDVKCNFFAANGKIKIQGDLLARNDISISGKAKINNVSCKQFKGVGGMDIHSISATNANITISNDCQVESVVSDDIIITKKDISLIEKKIANSISNIVGIEFDYESHKENARLSANTIEGTKVILDNVEADTVIGEDVIIGANCKIKNLKYKTKVNVDNTSEIINVEKINL